jgi:hypothetical protein
MIFLPETRDIEIPDTLHESENLGNKVKGKNKNENIKI